MAKSVLIVYEPLDTFRENKSYWNSYVAFYEKYWDGPSTPHSVWFGSDYENFRQSLSNHLGIDAGAIEDCFFIKDEGGRYYICPLGSKINAYILGSEDCIPAEWFLFFKEDERRFFYTHTGFGSLHFDGIYYSTKAALGLQRLEDADAIIETAFQRYQEQASRLSIFHKLNSILYGVRDLEAWLSGFDPEAKLILNYGEICSFIHSYTMENEHSVREMWEMLSLVKEDRIEEAELMLNVIDRKWDEIRKNASGVVDSVTIK